MNGLPTTLSSCALEPNSLLRQLMHFSGRSRPRLPFTRSFRSVPDGGNSNWRSFVLRLESRFGSGPWQSPKPKPLGLWDNPANHPKTEATAENCRGFYHSTTFTYLNVFRHIESFQACWLPLDYGAAILRSLTGESFICATIFSW